MDLHSDGGEGSSIEEDIRDEFGSFHKDNDTYRYDRGELCFQQSIHVLFFAEATVCPKKLKKRNFEMQLEMQSTIRK